ncbi:MAG: isopropylmalate isomerase [Pseudomonadota bacterium]
MSTTLTCAFTQWSPGLGDNNAMGWLTVAVYLAAALAAMSTARRMPGSEAGAGRERVFWWGAAGIMLALGVNKQLDLQSLMTMIARCNAQLSGWYDARRIVQEAFIYLIAAGAVVALGLVALLLRGILGRIWPALLGLGFVSLFVVVRAASFHNVDLLLGSTVAGIKLNWLLELPGPTLVALVALRRRKSVAAR